VQPALESGLADARDLSGLLRGEPLDITQHDGGPQRGRELAQGLAQSPAQFAVLGLPGWVMSGGSGQLQFVRPDRDARWPTGLLLQCAAGLVDRDPVEPGEVAGVALEAGDAPPGAQHYLLGHVLGFAAVAQQPQQQHVQTVGVGAR
jgi:hypothetical protein